MTKLNLNLDLFSVKTTLGIAKAIEARNLINSPRIMPYVVTVGDDFNIVLDAANNWRLIFDNPDDLSSVFLMYRYDVFTEEIAADRINNIFGKFICPNCNSTRVGTPIEEERIPYGYNKTDPIIITAQIPIRICSDCKFIFTDKSAEKIRDRAVKSYLGQ